MDHRSSPRTAKYQLDNTTIGDNFKEQKTNPAMQRRKEDKEGRAIKRRGERVGVVRIVGAL